MSNVVLYTTQTCPFCIRAKELLERKGISEYKEIAVDGSRDRRNEMMRVSGRHTVPQIFIGGTHVGGFTDLAQLERNGQLDKLLVG